MKRNLTNTEQAILKFTTITTLYAIATENLLLVSFLLAFWVVVLTLEILTKTVDYFELKKLRESEDDFMEAIEDMAIKELQKKEKAVFKTKEKINLKPLEEIKKKLGDIKIVKKSITKKKIVNE